MEEQYSTSVPHSQFRSVFKKTDIAYHQNLAFLLGFGRYAISVFFKNASTLRVLVDAMVSCRSYSIDGVVGVSDRGDLIRIRLECWSLGMV